MKEMFAVGKKQKAMHGVDVRREGNTTVYYVADWKWRGLTVQVINMAWPRPFSVPGPA